MSDLVPDLSYLLRGIGSSETIRDFRHASKTFVDNKQELAPKTQFMFHVFFNINPLIKKFLPAKFTSSTLKQIEAGILAKAADLPKFRIDTKTYNAYNRKSNIQSAIKYEPISITLHDDSANVTRDLWQAYMRYYYRDSDYDLGGAQSTGNSCKPGVAYAQSKYRARGTDAWGYSPMGEGEFFKDVQIYSLSQKKFSSYTLINPKIESFEHGNHDASSGNGIMEHRMRLNYEAVQYGQGKVSTGAVNGFGHDHYDTQPSPLSPLGGSTKSIFGPGGILESIEGLSEALARGDLGAAAMIALRAGYNLKDFNIKAAVGTTINEGIGGVIRGAASGNKPFSFPTF